MPPISTRVSALPASALRVPSLSEILAPPTIATNGRSGLSRTFPSAASSRAMSGPAAGRAKWDATPAVDACARCAVPKASLTYSSASAASRPLSSGSLLSSPASNRMFSRSSTSPGLAAATAWRATSPAVSGTNRTGRPTYWASIGATGASDSAGSGLPLARPRWEQAMTMAPRSARALTVGAASRTRVSSRTLPSLRGTLRSRRTRTRVPATSRSSIRRSMRHLPRYSRVTSTQRAA